MVLLAVLVLVLVLVLEVEEDTREVVAIQDLVAEYQEVRATIHFIVEEDVLYEVLVDEDGDVE